MRFRRPIERAARAAGVDPNLLEALVFLESAGRPDAHAPGGIEGATGLTQILAETGQTLLGMHVDVARSGSYTRRLDRALREGNARRVAALQRARRRVDDRFDPAKALAGTARYLTLASERFGREDLAFVSYHMGIGNLEGVLERFGGGRRSYAELYFDSTPTRHSPPTRGSRPSATTRPTTSGSSARRGRSCGSRAATPSGWGGSPRSSRRRLRAPGAARGRAAGRPARAAVRRRRTPRCGPPRASSCGPRRWRRALHGRPGARDWRRRCGSRARTTAAGRSGSRAATPPRAGARVPVRSRPSAGAQRDRLVALGSAPSGSPPRATRRCSSPCSTG